MSPLLPYSCLPVAGSRRQRQVRVSLSLATVYPSTLPPHLISEFLSDSHVLPLIHPFLFFSLSLRQSNHTLTLA